MTAPLTSEQLEAIANELATAQAEVDRLRAENARVMECSDRDQKAIADLQAERGRLQAQVAAVEALAKKWADADRVGMHRWGALEPSADELRATLASGDEVQ